MQSVLDLLNWNTMALIQIPPDKWVDQLNVFTHKHEGWLVTLEVFGPDAGAKHSLNDLPLLGISSDRSVHDGTITISVARSRAVHVTHVIRDVLRVYLDNDHDGAAAALVIEARDGTRSLLEVRGAPQPSP